MNWDDRIVGGELSEPLTARVERLFDSQMRDWEQLRNGVQGLARTQTRDFVVRGFPVVARHIPHRMTSTVAPVDTKSVQARACFLCSPNLPDEERAVPFDSDFVIAYNPFPILDRHLTVVLREHTPQRIEGRFQRMLSLAAELPGFVVLYNGPECGASAPDHMHFQACRSDGMPLIGDSRHASGGLIPGYSRSVIVLESPESNQLEDSFLRLMRELRRHQPHRSEPMINAVTLQKDGAWTVFVFPRSSHRPEAFHSGRLTWSPGSIDLCGVVVLPVEADLERITEKDIEDVFAEVSMDVQTVEKIADTLRLP